MYVFSKKRYFCVNDIVLHLQIYHAIIRLNFRNLRLQNLICLAILRALLAKFLNVHIKPLPGVPIHKARSFPGLPIDTEICNPVLMVLSYRSTGRIR